MYAISTLYVQKQTLSTIFISYKKNKYIQGVVVNLAIEIETENQLRAAMVAAGITPPNKMKFDGKVKRFSTNGKSSDAAGWYIIHLGPYPCGAFGDWRANKQYNFKFQRLGAEYSREEEVAIKAQMVKIREQIEQAKEEEREGAAMQAKKLWDYAQFASDDYVYLRRKNVKAHHARMSPTGDLIIPIYNVAGELRSLQFISANGAKKFYTGGEVKGNFSLVGEPLIPGSSLPIFLVEGFATAASVYEATDCPCYISFSASNLAPVAENLRKLYGPVQKIIIVADNDENRTGEEAAKMAASRAGCNYLLCPQGDANDYAQTNDLRHFLLPEMEKDTGLMIFRELDAIFGNQITEYEAPDELIEELICKNTVNIIYGASNSGKTFWAVEMAAAVCSGRKFMERETEHCGVVYLATEASRSVEARLKVVEMQYPDCDMSNLLVIRKPISFYENDVDCANVIQAIKAFERIKGIKVGLIIADTLARIAAGANENSGEDMGPVLKKFDALRAASGAAVAIIHHSGKNVDKGARGWSGLRCFIDTEIEISESYDVNKRMAKVTKQRELSGKGKEIYFTLKVLELGTTKFGKIATSCVAVFDSAPLQTTEMRQKDTIAKSKKIVEEVWMLPENRDLEGNTFKITKDALASYLIETQGLQAQAVHHFINIDATNPRNLGMALLRKHGLAEAIRDKNDKVTGFICIDPIWASEVLNMVKIVKIAEDRRS